jgi:hypothetical protein
MVSWLNCGYNQLLDCDFETQVEQQSAASLYQLLVFADAVGCPKALIKTCVAARADTSRFVLKLGQQEVHLDMSGLYYFGQMDCLTLIGWAPHPSTDEIEVGTAASVEERSAFMSQLAAQVEQLLYIAYKLQLEQLLGKVVKFIQSSTHFNTINPLLWEFMDTIVSKRAINAAAGSADGKSALIDYLTKVPFSFSKGVHFKQVLEPMDLPPFVKQPLNFQVVLKEGAFGLRAGTVVQVELDLFGASEMKVIDVGTVAVQLCVHPV